MMLMNHSSGELHLFAPSSTTYAKHFYNRTVLFIAHGSDYSQQVIF